MFVILHYYREFSSSFTKAVIQRPRRPFIPPHTCASPPHFRKVVMHYRGPALDIVGRHFWPRKPLVRLFLVLTRKKNIYTTIIFSVLFFKLRRWYFMYVRTSLSRTLMNICSLLVRMLSGLRVESKGRELQATYQLST